MKKKFSLWLNIATICLCICAIAIGVYAAQSATLTVTGSIGFTANGIKYSAKVEALGYVTDPDDVTTYQSSLVELTSVTDATESKTLSLTSSNKKLYFTDLKGDTVPNIEIKITVTNNSKFDITVAPNTQSCTDVTITKTDGNIATKNGGEASITYTLSLNKDDTTKEYKELSSTVSINIDLKKFIAKTDTSGNEIVVGEYSADEQSKIRANTVLTANSSYGVSYSDIDKSYAEEFPYYITMGKSTSTLEEEDLKWLIIGYNNDGTVVSLTNEDKAALAGHRLIKNKNYVALLEEALTIYNFLSDSNYTEDSDTSICKNTKSAYSSLGVNANDYYASDIREYLNGTFKTLFSLSDTSRTITIKERALSELYDDIYNEERGVMEGRIHTIYQVGDSKDDFWLLSEAEAYTLFNKADILSSPDYLLASSIATLQGKSSICDWWLRSPDSESDRAIGVDTYGEVGSYFDVFYASGLRPAFQF